MERGTYNEITWTKELTEMLEGWIVIADACALFAGWCPLEEHHGKNDKVDEQRRYQRISDGIEAKPSVRDFALMERYQQEWLNSKYASDIRNAYMGGIGVAEVYIEHAFAMGMTFEEQYIKDLCDFAIAQNIVLELADPANNQPKVVLTKELVDLAFSELDRREGGEFQVPRGTKVVFDTSKDHFKVEGRPTKPNTKLLLRFLEHIRDQGKPMPNEDDFLEWVAETKPKQAHITITRVTDKMMVFTNNGDPVPKKEKNFDKDAIAKRIAEYCTEL